MASTRRAAAPFVPGCRAAFKTVSQIGVTDRMEGGDSLLLCGIHRRHLVIGGHALFMWRGVLSRDFRGNAVGRVDDSGGCTAWADQPANVAYRQ
jgi:hypothetical protein